MAGIAHGPPPGSRHESVMPTLARLERAASLSGVAGRAAGVNRPA
jgi:hypothetical protein